uniref:hypothetical protein n=1 Tax=Prochlorococcus marinus TaxID=1219 RepID=UPI00164F1DE2|nr:hypothetical protein [Prochlorococcus marinus]
MPVKTGQISRYGAFSKTSIPLPYQYNSLGVVFLFYLRIIGMEVLGIYSPQQFQKSK